MLTAAQQFVVCVKPWRLPESLMRLRALAQVVRRSGLSGLDLDAVFLRILVLLQEDCRRSVGPDLVSQYVNNLGDTTGRIEHFLETVSSFIRGRRIRHRSVALAIEMIDSRFADSALRQREVAASLRISSSELAVLFRRHTGRTFSHHLREVRLTRAAEYLREGHKSIKEIWSTVGYNHASNFDHDFKRTFGLTPGAYRLAAALPAVRSALVDSAASPARSHDLHPSRVLVVDDDREGAEALCRYLRVEGHTAVLTGTVRDALSSARQQYPDAVLIDYHLPDGDGVQILEELTSSPSRPSASCVLFTADWCIEEREAEIKALGGSLLWKPCSIEVIIDALQLVGS